ncbi:MAG: hypothetical protein ASARMPREDX12_000114 [Alectoria sarmentosa]|nr:MAG: hypothetical protein ASARMPREDX12_000114 [Alectoria sarmentosa]
MSYSNGYANGSYRTNRHEDSQDDSDSLGGSRQRRAGAYGGFYNGAPSVPAETEAQPSLPSFRRQGSNNPVAGSGLSVSRTRDADGYDTSRSSDRVVRDQNGARQHGSGPGGRQIEGVLDHIHENWEVITKDDCVPVHIALQLMDYSSLGRGNDYQDFQRTNRHLQKALKAIVNEHHQGFNSSIGTFHKIQASIQASQSRVRSLRDSVQGAKSNLMATKPELKGLGSSSQKYDDMLQILAQIEKLQLIPEQLDARISDKHFLLAVDLLQDALRIIRRSDLENIGALTDLRMYFSNQETSLTDILIEELHDHLYLKSPYCQDRWKPYTGDSANISASETGKVSLPNTWGRPLYRFLDSLDTTSPLDDDASQNPETDSFHYIHMVTESLNKLGHLDVAVDRMEQRLPVELFAIVDRTNQEVDLRHPAHKSGPLNPEKSFLESNWEGITAGSVVLNDLLWTLFSKFEAIAEGHRAFHEVVAGIVKRERLRHPESLTRGFKEMWKLYQSEMRSLLHDYLATDENQSYRLGRQPAAAANIFHKNHRERNKRVFKLSEIDQKSADLTADQRDLDQILQASVPGLVSKSQRWSGVLHKNTNFTPDGSVASHKLLVDPDVFNISSLLPPSLSFLQRLRDIVPHGSGIAMSTLTSFLDEFLVNVFQPQLEETVTESSLVRRPQLHAQDEVRLKTAATMADSGDVREVAEKVLKGFAKEKEDDPLQKEAKMLIAKTNEKPLDPFDILFDRRSVTALCLMYSSMRWLAIRLQQLRRIVPESSLSHRDSTKPQLTRHLSLLSSSQPIDPNTPIYLPMTQETAEAFDSILASMRTLAITALVTLHIDIRLGVIHMLTRTLHAPYLLAQQAQDPDPSILSLNADLLSFADNLATHLDTSAQHFITNGLALLIDTLLVSNAFQITAGMNDHGCSRMQLNISVLSRNLKSIQTSSDGYSNDLARSTHFYNLFMEGADSILERAKDRGGEGLEAYDLEELKALVELWYKDGLESGAREVQVKSRRELGDKLLVLSESDPQADSLLNQSQQTGLHQAGTKLELTKPIYPSGVTKLALQTGLIEPKSPSRLQTEVHQAGSPNCF